MRRLTDDEWSVVTAPFSHVKTTNPSWKAKHRILISRWLDNHPSDGWFYEAGETAIFERSDDALAYRLWISRDPFDLKVAKYVA